MLNRASVAAADHGYDRLPPRADPRKRFAVKKLEDSRPTCSKFGWRIPG